MDEPVANPSATRMRWARRMHLYLSCFFAPLLMFFVATGWYQTVTERSNKKTVSGVEEDWVSKLRSVHVDQYYPNSEAVRYEPTLFKMLVVGMSVALLVTIGLGIYLGFRSNKNPWRVCAALILGLGLPILFLWLGQRMRS